MYSISLQLFYNSSHFLLRHFYSPSTFTEANIKTNEILNFFDSSTQFLVYISLIIQTTIKRLVDSLIQNDCPPQIIILFFFWYKSIVEEINLTHYKKIIVLQAKKQINVKHHNLQTSFDDTKNDQIQMCLTVSSFVLSLEYTPSCPSRRALCNYYM